MIETITKCYCDFCGKKIIREDPESYYRLEFEDMSMVQSESEEKLSDMFIDLCKTCATNVHSKIEECKPGTE